jgi:hypothetical protein
MAFNMNDWFQNLDTSGWSPNAQRMFGDRTGGGGGGATATAPKAAAPPSPLEKMLQEAERLAGLEDGRHLTESMRLDAAGRRFDSGFEADEGRLSSMQLGSSLDQIGRGATDATNRLRVNLGGRGIDPSSGTAAALASRIGMQQQGLKYGAMRGAAQDSYQRRNAHRTAQYAQDFGRAQFGIQSPSLLRLDSLTNQAEFDLARDVSKDQIEAAKIGAKAQKSAARSAGIGSIIGGILGGI